MKIGVIGVGVVGGTTAKVFARAHELFLYDKYKSLHNSENNLKELVRNSEIIFLCVPTPMKSSGEIDYSAIHNSLSQITEISKQVNRDPKEILIVIRSTAVSGTTDKLEEKYPFHFVFNPEFLTEKNALTDMENTSKVVIGANRKSDYDIVEQVYKPLFPNARYICVDTKTAEMIKYASNVTLAGQIAIANEIYQICKAIGVDYNTVKNAIILDEKIGKNINVPGHDGDLGFGGKCLVAGTKIRKENEIINIEELKIGDRIYDEENITEVTQIGKRKVENLILISARGREIIGSKDHIHLIIKKDSFIKKELRDIRIGDLVYVPKQKEFSNIEINLGKKPNKYITWWPEKIKINEDLARLIGLYLSEGCSGIYKKKNKENKEYSVIWSYGENERSLADETVSILKNLGLNPFVRLQISKGTYGISRCWIVRIRSQGFCELIKKLNLGSTANLKNPPLLPPKYAKLMIGGWLDGDGNYDKGTLSCTSISKELILKMDSLLLSLGINSQIHQSCNNSWTLRISMKDDVRKVSSWTRSKRLKFDEKRYARNFSYSSPTSKPFKNGWAVKVNKIEELSGDEVYSLETKSHKYIANNILTHNCFPKDLNALIYLSRENMYRPYLLEEVWRLNERVRKKKDWLEIPGATSGNQEFNKE